MKVQAQKFFEVVRQVVQEEVKKQLPGLVKEVLAESYIRRMVAETPRHMTQGDRPGRPSALAETLESDEDEAPMPPENDDQGIYNPSNPQMQLQRESRRGPLFDKGNSLSFIYENVRPIPMENSPGSDAGDQAPPINAMAQAGIDFERMGRILKGMEKKSIPALSEENPEFKRKMIEIEKRRQMLDVPA